MSATDKDKKLATPQGKGEAGREGDPEWTNGLRRLYDSVLDEPLPDSFMDLLSKLDEDGGK